MVKARDILSGIILASVIGLSGVVAAGIVEMVVGGRKTNDYAEGKVIQEYGNGIESTYILKVKTPQGIYTIYTYDLASYFGGPGTHTIDGLAALIEEGTRIRFPLRYGVYNIFPANSNITGKVDVDDIQILEE